MTDSASNFPVMGYMDICLACRTRYQCLVRPSDICPGFIPIEGCDFKLVFSGTVEDKDNAYYQNPVTVCKAILITGYNKRYELEGHRIDEDGFHITAVKTKESGIRNIV